MPDALLLILILLSSLSSMTMNVEYLTRVDERVDCINILSPASNWKLIVPKKKRVLEECIDNSKSALLGIYKTLK